MRCRVLLLVVAVVQSGFCNPIIADESTGLSESRQWFGMAPQRQPALDDNITYIDDNIITYLIEENSQPSRMAPQPIESRQTLGMAPRPPMTSRIEIGDVSYTLPFSFPSATEIRQAIPDGTLRPGNGDIQCELLTYNVEDAKSYPIVGCARLSKVHFKCTVT